MARYTLAPEGPWKRCTVRCVSHNWAIEPRQANQGGVTAASQNLALRAASKSHLRIVLPAWLSFCDKQFTHSILGQPLDALSTLDTICHFAHFPCICSLGTLNIEPNLICRHHQAVRPATGLWLRCRPCEPSACHFSARRTADGQHIFLN